MRVKLRLLVLIILISIWIIPHSLGQSPSSGSILPAKVPENGFLSPTKYTNAFFGFCLPLPRDPDLQGLSRDAKGPSLSHFLIGFASSGSPNSTFIITATDKGIGSKNQAKSDAAGPNGQRTKKILVGDKTFWKSESNRKTQEGESQTLTFATELNGYVLQFYIVSFDPKLTAELEQSIEALTFFDPAKAQEVAGPDSRVYNPSAPQLNNRISQLSDGAISGGMYYNSELGFRYRFPDGWTLYDKVAQEEMANAGHQFVWRGPFTGLEHAQASQCTKNLLLMTRYAAGMKLNRFNPVVLLMAADPNCAPGVTFPTSVKDREAIQRIANHVAGYFKPSTTTSAGPVRVRAFDNAGRVMLEISQSLSFSTNEPERATFYNNIRSSLLLMQAEQYWVMWMFATDDDAELSQLRATKIFFNRTPTPAADPK